MSCCESSSSSSDCGACEKKCESSCSLKKCCVELPEACNAGQIACKYSDAVVSVVSQWVFVSGGGETATAPVTDVTPLASGLRQDFELRGNGFFIKNGWIVTAASNVFAPPSFSGLVQRWPLINPAVSTVGQIENQMIRASQIIVAVSNVNGSGKSYAYTADVVSVDGANDIAFLKILYPCCNGAASAPKVRVKSKKGKKSCHPSISFAEKCYKAQRGETVFLLGSYNAIANNAGVASYGASIGAVLQGIVTDPCYLDPYGNITYEALLVSSPVYAPTVGSPILNGHGHLISMQTANVAGIDDDVVRGLGFVGGVQGKRLREDLKLTLKQLNKSCADDCKVENVRDPAGPYYRILKGYLGIAYTAWPPANNTFSTDFTSGDYGAAFPRVRISANGDIASLPRDSQVEGIQVIGLAGLNPLDSVSGITGGYWYVPGGTGASPLVLDAPASPLIGRIGVGDQILSIQKCNGKKWKKEKLGFEPCETAPSNVLWRLKADDEVDISYVTTSEYVSATGSNAPLPGACCTDCRTTKATVLTMPAIIDYPWYALQRWPLLSDFGFTSVNSQSLDPQTPILDDGAPFHTAV